MALAEARAAWQRTANRCLVQEDAKRAPKLACCSSMAPSVIQAETGPTDASGGQDIPSVGSLPFDRNPSYSNFIPSSNWWLQMPTNYGYHKGMMDEQFISLENNCKTWKLQEGSGHPERIGDQILYFESSADDKCRNVVTSEKKDFSVKEDKIGAFHKWECQDHMKVNAKENFGELSDEGFLSEVSKYSSDLYFDSESSWIGGSKNTPWWRTADAEELALLVAQRSLDLIDNCDLPRPQNELYPSPNQQKATTGNSHHLHTNDFKPGSPAAKSSCGKLRMTIGDQLASGSDKTLRQTTVHERTSKMQAKEEEDTGKAQLLEALRHSQTRAREAEQVAKQACAEKEHIIKLVLRQASQLFAYRQWIQLLQLENMYIQFKNSESQAASKVVPETIPWKPLKRKKMDEKWEKSWSRKGLNKQRNQWMYDVGKYSVVFAVGMGMIGAGLLLGWSIGWILPIWL